MKYRKEIDGLRAVAVLPVVFFHAGMPGFEGGYIGVDVFFVISGYLITALILQDVGNGKYSFRNFYERRARRILPALFFVTLVSVPFAWTLMMPGDFENFSASVVSVGMFLSNFYFWSEAGYFDTAIELKPLIHTWSLAAEEQYYLLIPVLLVAASSLGRRWIGWALWLILGLSFALSVRGSIAFPDANFFLLPSRAWELMVGGLLAYYEKPRENMPQSRIGSTLCIGGLACIAVSIAVFDANTRHPGLLTLLPVAGTALIIRYGQFDGLANKFLSLRVIVGIGLISYSLYLWHQPVFVFARLYSADFLRASDHVPLILLSFILSIVSWKYVESPFRKRTLVPARKIWALTGSAIVLVTVIGLAGWLGMLRPNIGPILENAARIAKSNPNMLFAKDGVECRRRPPDTACILGAPNRPVTWALVGDSHAGILGLSVDNFLQRNNLAGVQLTGNGCPYTMGLERMDVSRCLVRNSEVRERLKRDDIKVVVVSGRYVLQMEKTRFDNGEGGREFGKPAGYTPPGKPLEDKFRRAVVSLAYREAIEDLLRQGKKVVLVYPIPEVGWDVPHKIFREYERQNYDPITTDFEVFRRRTEAVFRAFDSISDSSNLLRVYPHKLLCDKAVRDRCVATDGDSIYYFDEHHLSYEGADMLVAHIESRVKDYWELFPPPVPENHQ
jgi:peptidoglycan/LPS O-acetylase OafA/YrhL